MAKKIKTFERLPYHVGIIIDGNGRWATRRGLPRNAGHRQGMIAVENIIDSLIKYQIKIVSFFAFSTENWKRSREEVDGIFDILRSWIASKQEKLFEKGIKIVTMGDLTALPDDVRDALKNVVEKTKNNDTIIVNLALNYGGRADIVQAVNKLISRGEKRVDEKMISDALYSANLPDPDLVIRTSGERRISNFMIYQMAYSELYFPKVLWPDFDEKDLLDALEDYSKRERRFGGIKK